MNKVESCDKFITYARDISASYFTHKESQNYESDLPCVLGLPNKTITITTEYTGHYFVRFYTLREKETGKLH